VYFATHLSLRIHPADARNSDKISRHEIDHPNFGDQVLFDDCGTKGKTPFTQSLSPTNIVCPGSRDKNAEYFALFVGRRLGEVKAKMQNEKMSKSVICIDTSILLHFLALFGFDVALCAYHPAECIMKELFTMQKHCALFSLSIHYVNVSRRYVPEICFIVFD
jgi:hypothetical protein